MITFTQDDRVTISEAACENLLPFVLKNLHRLGVTEPSISDAVTAASDQEYGRLMLILWSCGAKQEEATHQAINYVEVFKGIFETKLRDQLEGNVY